MLHVPPSNARQDVTHFLVRTRSRPSAWWCRPLMVLAVMLPGVLSIAHGQDDSSPADAMSAEDFAVMQRYQAIEWTEGPTTLPISSMAQIAIPEDYWATGANGAQELLELYGNPPDDSTLAAIQPLTETENWTLIFEFDPIGYVDDADRESLDANSLIADFRAGIEPGNQARRSMGLEEIRSMGWREAPFYDPQTNNLTWALSVQFKQSGETINRDIRLLGRRGVMQATLVCDPGEYDLAIPQVDRLLRGFEFTDGNQYAQWVSGDKVASVGLMGLIAGGAAVGAAKTGLLAKLGLLLAKGGKAVVVGLLAVVAGVGSVFKNLFGGGKEANS